MQEVNIPGQCLTKYTGLEPGLPPLRYHEPPTVPRASWGRTAQPSAREAGLDLHFRNPKEGVQIQLTNKNAFKHLGFDF